MSTATVSQPAAEPKSGPLHADTKSDGSRWYIHPKTGERFISVTTVLSNIAKFGLTDWAGRLSAEAAFTRLPLLVRASRIEPCNATGDDACGQCRACVTGWLANRHNEVRDDAADKGRRVHDAAEQIALFGEGAHVDEDIKPFVDQYLRWRAVYRPTYEATEMTVISRKWGYAGTLDGIFRFADDAPLPPKLKHLLDVLVLEDTKTGKHLGLPNSWQVNAYAKADVVLLPDGSEVPMPEVKGGLILHVRPDKVQMREAYLTDENHANFIHMLRVSEGLGAGLGTGLSRPVNLPKGN